MYVAIAPHRLREARVVSAADLTSRPAAPGALLSVLGTRVESADSDDIAVPVLDASETSSQIQVPFEAKGNTVSLSLSAAAGRFTVGLPLQAVSPAIFVDSEGTPLILDASTGVLLDSSKPAHANAHRAGSRDGIGPSGTGLAHWSGCAAQRSTARGGSSSSLSGRRAGRSDAGHAGAGIRRFLSGRDPTAPHY